MRLVLQAFAVLAVLAGEASAGERAPVMVGGNPDFDACGSNGRVHNLGPVRREDPKSGFLSVRSGPGGKGYDEIDRIDNGQELFVCDEIGPWLAVVYSADGRPREGCGVTSPVPVRRAYRGACRSGWVHRRYVDVYAG